MKKDKYELTTEETSFIEDVRNIISTAKEHTYKTANLMIVVSNWLVGRRIVLQEQKGKDRAEYGKRIITIASQELTRSFGKGYAETTLKNYRKFYMQFSNLQIRQPLLAEFEKRTPSIRQPLLAESESDVFELRPQLSWMHYERLMRVDDKQALIDTRENEDINIFLDCMASLHIAHLKQDINLFVDSVVPEMVDKHQLQKEMVDKWSIKASLAEKLVDILKFMADKEKLRTENLVKEMGLTDTTAKRYLRQLAELGYIEAHGGNRNRYYTKKSNHDRQ